MDSDLIWTPPSPSPSAAMMTAHMNGYVESFEAIDMAVEFPGDLVSPPGPPLRLSKMERIQNYQEELRKRREEEGRYRSLHPTLNTSSQKLNKPSQSPKVGTENPPFSSVETPQGNLLDPGNPPSTGKLKVRVTVHVTVSVTVCATVRSVACVFRVLIIDQRQILTSKKLDFCSQVTCVMCRERAWRGESP